MRRGMSIVAALLFATLLMPAGGPAQAATQFSISFSGRISFIEDDGAVPPNPVEVWAPISPACGSTPCPRNTNFDWVYDDEQHPAGVETCVAQALGGGIAAHVDGVHIGTNCEVSGLGNLIGAGFGGLSPYCGMFFGPADFTVTVGGFSKRVIGLGSEHPGNTFVWRLVDPGSSLTKGVGVMHVVEYRGGCGLDPFDDFAPATEALVVGSLTFAWPF